MMPYLSLAIWVPIVAGLAVLAVGRDRDAARRALDRARRRARRLRGHAAAVARTSTRPRRRMQFVERGEWIPRFDIHYFLGVDGISMLFVLLNSLMTLLVVWAGWEVIQIARRAVHGGVPDPCRASSTARSAALDGILFYVFFEAMLIPMYLIIGVWGGPNRVYAAIKFFLYTLLGSLLMLVALIYLYNVSRDASRSSSGTACRCRSRCRCCCSSRSSSRSRSRCRCGRCTPGCRTRTSRRRPAAR